MMTQDSIKICLVIPCYRHAAALYNVLLKTAPYGFDTIIVDDGNDSNEKALIQKCADDFDRAAIVSHEKNLGKGYAVATGMLYARSHGYTHVIQLDSDGQHDTDDLPEIIQLIKDNPEAVISGEPVYDSSAPRSRVIGRRITNFFVHIETLSSMIKDAMIGFRAYPVCRTCQVIEKYNLRSGMNFDIELLVRMCNSGVRVLFFKTKVKYPKNGVSNFKGIDNLYISLMHTKLCFITALTFPLILYRRYLSGR